VVVLFSDIGDDHHVDVYPKNPEWSEDKIHRFILLGLIKLAMEKPGERFDVLLDPLLAVVDGGESVH